jgi:hypothetical protein
LGCATPETPGQKARGLFAIGRWRRRGDGGNGSREWLDKIGDHDVKIMQQLGLKRFRPHFKRITSGKESSTWKFEK